MICKTELFQFVDVSQFISAFGNFVPLQSLPWRTLRVTRVVFDASTRFITGNVRRTVLGSTFLCIRVRLRVAQRGTRHLISTRDADYLYRAHSAKEMVPGVFLQTAVFLVVGEWDFVTFLQHRCDFNYMYLSHW